MKNAENQDESIRLYLTNEGNLYITNHNNILLNGKRNEKHFLTLLQGSQKLGIFTSQFYLGGDRVTIKPDPELGWTERMLGKTEVIQKSLNAPKQDVERVRKVFESKITVYTDSLKKTKDAYNQAVNKAEEERQRAVQNLGSRPSLDDMLVKELFR